MSPPQGRILSHVTSIPLMEAESYSILSLWRAPGSPVRFRPQRMAYLAAILFGPRKVFFGSLMAGRLGVESIVTASRKRSTA
jgi:hypothetical protein